MRAAHGTAPRSIPRSLVLFVILSLAAGVATPVLAWTDATRSRMLRDALKVIPPSLNAILVTYHADLERGMLTPSQHEGEEVHFQMADGSSGLAAAAVVTVDRQARALLEEKHGLRPFCFEMGALAHLTADVSFPLSVSEKDPREPLYREAYRSYIEKTLGKIPFVLDTAPAPRLDKGDLEGYLKDSARRAGKNYALIGAAFNDDGTPRSRSALDERSVPFGVASLAYSQAVNDIVRVWTRLWGASGGDMRAPSRDAAAKPGAAQTRRGRDAREDPVTTPSRQALLSVYDKTGVVDLARRLVDLSYRILSTGGTASALREAGIPVVDVSSYTGHPEILGGRVKTLHPKVHGGLLADPRLAEHRADMERAGLASIDLLVVNLYPFQKVAAREDAPLGELIEMIDIGGPAMIRSAAKNHASVGVVVDPADYAVVLEELAEGGTLKEDTRRRLAVKAFAHTSAYDGVIRDTLARRFAPLAAAAAGAPGENPFPEELSLSFRRLALLRYGENPHQRGALYADASAPPGTVATARQVQGKELSFNNLLDLDAAWRLVREFEAPAAVIVKHNNPCGAALAATAAEAFAQARKTDPVSAFGGIVAFNRGLDAEAASAVTGLFLECIIAPGYAAAAREILSAKSALRVLEIGPAMRPIGADLDLRRISGGLLVQDADAAESDLKQARVVTRRAPTAEELRALDFAWRVAKHVKSNAIVLAHADRLVGVGAGQMSRVDSVRLAVAKAQEPVPGTVMASDAFFPFRDGIDEAAKAGVAAVVQPGGSMRDAEVIASADEHDLAMIVTGVRHFRH